ncbi:MAG: MMPL family transporter [Gemmatimonadetes bacterium]|nr:MMPL family transporter [Gemmatimonadota bacterium]
MTLVLALGGAYACFAHLEIVSNQEALTDPDLPFNRRSSAYEANFGRWQDPLVLALRAGSALDGEPRAPTPAERQAMKEVAARWAAEIRKRSDLFLDVRERVAPAEMRSWALLYLPEEELQPLARSTGLYLPTLSGIAAAPSLSGMLETLNAGMADMGRAVPAGGDARGLGTTLGALEDLFRWMRTEVESPNAAARQAPAAGTEASPLAALTGEGRDPEGYLFTSDGRLLTAVATVMGDSTRQNRFEEPLRYAREALGRALAAVPAGVQVSGGLTGRPALEQEEMVTTQRDFTRASIIAFVAVSLLFMWGLRSVLRPALAALTGAMSVAMTFGFAWMAIGHLNVLALVFVVIVVSLGIDFAIHFYVHYREAMAAGGSPARAIRRTYRAVGGALWMDGLATAGAFLVAWFTDFPGLSELGIISGAGLLIALGCTYVVFPAMLHLLDRRFPPKGAGAGAGLGVIRAAARPPVNRWSRAYLFGMLALAGAGFAFGDYEFDVNLLSLQPVRGEAYRWQRLLMESDERTSFAIATFSSREEMEPVRAALEALPVVQGTEAVFPFREAEKRALLRPLCTAIADVEVAADAAPDPARVRRELFGLRQTIRRYRQSGEEAGRALAGLEREIAGLYLALGRLQPGEAQRRLGTVQGTIRQSLRGMLGSGESLFCPAPLSAAQAPGPVRERYLGRQGTLALFIYSAVDTWEGPGLRRFVGEVRKVEPAVFGGVVNFYENTRLMIRSFAQAALYSSVVIVLMLLLWTRSVRTTLLALVPLVVGMGLLLGVMRWGPFPLRWNLGNFFAVPILIGTGMAGGIHPVRAWRHGGPEAFRGSLVAVTISALTTMIGFGLLVMGEHRGVASLGLIILLGVGFNLLASLTVLPLALRVFDPRERQGEGRGGARAAGAVALVLVFALATPAGAQTGESFLMVKPGDAAATQARAAGFLAEMSAYLQSRVPRLRAGALRGLLANRRDAGAEILRRQRPSLALVPPEFYFQHLSGGARQAVPVAEIPRFGATTERYYLVAPRGGAGSLQALRGRTVYTAVDVDERYLSRVVFPAAFRPGQAFRLSPSANLADAVFDLVEGGGRGRGPAAVLLTEESKRFFEQDELVWPELRVVWSSPVLPRDLVVALGDWSQADLQALRAALFRMGDDPRGRRLLAVMQARFVAVDEPRLRAAGRKYGGRE